MSYERYNELMSGKLPEDRETRSEDRPTNTPRTALRQVDPAMKAGYETNKERVSTLLGFQRDLEKVFKGGHGIYLKSFEIMTNDMDVLMAGHPAPECPENCAQGVKVAIDRLLTAITFDPMTPYLRDLGLEFCKLTFNWASQCSKRKDIERVSQSVTRMILGHQTMKEVMDTIKRLIDEAKKTYNYAPGAYDLSKHYLQSFKDELEK